LERKYPGVVHQDVDGPESLHRSLNHCLHAFRATDVGDDPVGDASRARDVGHHPLHVGLSSGVHTDERSFSRKELGHGLPDSPPGAGDDDHLARQSR
jgi:hypothetical protein